MDKKKEELGLKAADAVGKLVCLEIDRQLKRIRKEKEEKEAKKNKKKK